jgi:HAD superfamily hydrolase (TIGR01509 family)
MENLSSSNSHPPVTGLLELHRELAQAWGLDFQRVRALVCQLTSGHWCSVSELIARTLLSRWNVTHLLRRFQPWLERDQDCVRIRIVYLDLFRAVFDCSRLSSERFLTPYEIAARAGEEAAQAEAFLASLERIVNDLPMRPVRHLDHVSATALTCLKRALFLAKNYDLGGATILRLARHAAAFITRRVRSAFPGVVETIRALHRQGYTLHTASGESSLDLEGYLHAMGVRDCFGRLYGPDLIETLKEGPEYYERIFADLGITAAEVLVVDDSPHAIVWATQVGARTVLIGNASLLRTGATVHIGSLVALHAALQPLD